MSEAKPGFISQIKSYPATFWVANTMEIFERMSWYGWFTVMAVYVTGSVATGGLGFTTELRGALQGIVPFFLYLFPVLTGALADRYGFKRMFVIAYLVMIVSYYLLGQFNTVATFFGAFMFVAVGAALFKPVVVGTVAKVTNEGNSATGFGIFYMMVNIGGFVGPIVAGFVRGWGWEYVFVACAAWAGMNLVIVLLFYREPEGVRQAGKFRKVLDNAVEVLGNLRFFITVFVVLFALMFANLNIWWFTKFTWLHCAIFVPAWIIFNFLWDAVLPSGSGRPDFNGGNRRNPLVKRMHCSNWRFALFLLIMSGFWTSFNQIFYTMPEYIRDFVDTRPLIRLAEGVFGESDPDDPDKGVASIMATINELERDEIIRHLYDLRTALGDGEEAERQLLAILPEERFDEVTAEVPPELKAVFDPPELPDAPADERSLADKIHDLGAVQFGSLMQSAKSALGSDWHGVLRGDALMQTSKTLLHSKVRMSPDRLDNQMDTGGPALSAQDRQALTAALTALAGKIPAGVDTAEDMMKDKEVYKVLEEASQELAEQDIRISEALLAETLAEEDTAAAATRAVGLVETNPIADRVIISARQVNPEYIVNINAGAIVLFQVLISFSMGRFHRFTTMIVGMLIASVGIGFSTLAGSPTLTGLGATIWIVAGGIFIFSFGEMMASPTSQEYVGRIAPREKVALYMGYYFVAVALGNLFGGILSGELMAKFAYEMGRPDLMWLSFGGVMLGTALIFVLYNKLALPKNASHELT